MSRAWMPMYWGDYLADTRHLTTLQHGAYLLLIAHYWQHGGLPDNDIKLKQICGLTCHQWRSNCLALASMFLPQWKHKRIDAELEKANDIKLKRSVFGRKGGLISRGKNNDGRLISAAIVAPNAKQMGHQSQSHIELSSLGEANGTAASGLARKEVSSSLKRTIEQKGWTR